MKLSAIIENKAFYLLAALLPVVVFFGLLFSVIHSPYLGFEFERKGEQWYLKSTDAAVHGDKYAHLTGARILEIAGQEIGADTLELEINARHNKNDAKGIFTTVKYFSQHIRTGEAVSLVFEDQDKISVIEIVPVSYPAGKYLLDNLSLFVTAFLTLLVGLFLVLKRPDNHHARLMYLISFFLTMECVTMPILYLGAPGYDFIYFLIFFNIMQVAVYYFLASVSYFVLAFPSRHQLLDNKAVVYSIWLLPFSYLYFFYINMIFPLFIAYIIGMCLFPIIIAAYKYATISSPDMRAQIKTIMLGIMLGFILALALFFLPVILVGKSIIPANWILCVGIVFPVFTAFAIMRYKLMDIDTLFDNTLIYSITIFILASLDLFIIYILTDAAFARFDIPQPLVVIFAVWIIIFAYIPIRNLIKNIIKRLLKREMYDINQVALSLSNQMLSAEDIRSAFDRAVTVISDTLHPKGVEYSLMGERVAVLAGNRYSIALAELYSYKKPVSLFEMGSSEKGLPDNYTGGALVPVVGTKGHLGYFVLQDKHSQRLYDSEDMKLLSVIASQLALTLEAIQYKEELHKKDEQTQKEKQRLIKDIHDGLGGTLTNMNLLTYMAAKKDSVAEIREILDSLSDLSKESIFEVQNLYAIIETKEVKWDMFVSALERFGQTMLEPHGIDFRFSYNAADGAPLIIDNTFFVNIYKIYKEAISNIVKYSRATQVFISLRMDKESLSMSITDNGIGLSGSDRKGRGLNNMKERAAEAGASLEITSDKGVMIFLQKRW